VCRINKKDLFHFGKISHKRWVLGFNGVTNYVHL
jgi:hypothetical protein